MATAAAGLQGAGRYKHKQAAAGTGKTSQHSRCNGSTEAKERTTCDAEMAGQKGYETSSWRSLELDQGT